MKITIPDFLRARLLVAGDLMLDRYWQGSAARISPEAPVPVVKVDAIEERAGGAGNVALNIAALGCQVKLLAYTGEDEAALCLQRILEPAAVSCAFIRLAGTKTITKLRILSRHQQLLRADFEESFAALNHNAFKTRFNELLPSCQAVVLSDYGKGSLREVSALIAQARAQRKPVLVDPKGTDYNIYRGATLLTPNQSEFDTVAGASVDEQDFFAKAQQLRATLELQALLVTRSEKGMVLFTEHAPPLVVPTHAREVYDVTGAGDTVIAVLAAAIAAGLEFEDATRLSNLAAGIVVGKLGTASVSVTELNQAMLALEPLPRGVVQDAELLQWVAKAKASGERIVMTNGCFDILHAGHVTYLAQAAALGDRLVVAVNSDASVSRLKGAGRPINALAQRMVVLAALQSVDWVVAFDKDTPADLIECVRPNVLVKGGDYRPEQIAGADAVRAAGGEVVVLDYIDGCSSSAIIQAIQQSSN